MPQVSLLFAAVTYYPALATIVETGCFQLRNKMKTSLLKGAFFALSLAFSLAGNAAEEKMPPASVETKCVILPYLQNPTDTAITVCFLSRDAAGVKVVFSEKNNSAESAQPAAGTAIPGTPWTIWKTRLTDLTPGKTYNYRVVYTVAGKAAESAGYTFTAFNSNAPTVRAAVFNDIHDRLPTLEAVLKNVTPGDFEFTILNGDMWNNPSPKNGAERVFRTMEGYVRMLDASNKPMLYVRGNHDTRGYFADHLSYLFDLPNNDPTADFPEQSPYFDFRAGPVWFISPDAGEDGDKREKIFQAYRERQVDWLKKLFAESPARNAAWRVMPLHIPLYNSSCWDQPDALKRWEPVYKNEKIDLMIAGHDHAWRNLEKGKTYARTREDEKGNKIEEKVIPPFPVLIGGGPTPDGKGDGIATVILLKADKSSLEARMITAKQEEVAKVELKK